MRSFNTFVFSLLCLFTRLASGYDLIEQQIIDGNQFGIKSLFRPAERQQQFTYPPNNFNRNFNFNSNFNKNYNYNFNANYKDSYFDRGYNKANHKAARGKVAGDYANQINTQNYGQNYGQINKQNAFLDGYQNKPEYFSYQTIEQRPFKSGDVQQKVEDEGQWDKVPLFVDKKTFDHHARKMKEQRMMRKKQSKPSSLKKYDEIRQLEKIRYRLQAAKVRVQEQIEELKNLEYRCRRKRLYFFDTMMRNTANILKSHEQDIDSQLERIDELCQDFVAVYDQIEQNRLQVKSQSMNFDYSYDSKRSDDENGLLYGGNSGYIGTRVQALSKETIEDRLKEPRKSLDQVQAHSDKLISINKSRLDKIKIVVKDFKKEFKDKL